MEHLRPMMNGTINMKLEQARQIAGKVMELLAPQCVRIEIAGSIRRGEPEVGDIEIVAVPGEFADAILPTLLPGAKFIKNGSRYKQIALPPESGGINLDLFLVRPPAQWGVLFTIRTGPADFSHWIVTRRCFGGRLPSNCRVQDGQVFRYGFSLPMPEEEDFLWLLDLEGVTPAERGAKVPPTWRSLHTGWRPK
jgi:DNA polymerase/3'-5' exonuclease PolX